jgi:hypothetical protein
VVVVVVVVIVVEVVVMQVPHMTKHTAETSVVMPFKLHAANGSSAQAAGSSTPLQCGAVITVVVVCVVRVVVMVVRVVVGTVVVVTEVAVDVVSVEAGHRPHNSLHCVRTEPTYFGNCWSVKQFAAVSCAQSAWSGTPWHLGMVAVAVVTVEVMVVMVEVMVVVVTVVVVVEVVSMHELHNTGHSFRRATLVTVLKHCVASFSTVHVAGSSTPLH